MLPVEINSKLKILIPEYICNRLIPDNRILVGKPERKRPLRRPRCRWVDNIKMDLKRTEWGGMDWIDLAQGRCQWRALVTTVMNLWVP
jgi:hypothetical protein